MSSLDIATSPPIRRDETVQISLLLAFTGGYLDAHTWIIQGAMANAQTASPVLLCTLIEIVLLIAVGILHNRLQDMVGTLGISFVAAMQTAIFNKVEGAAYSSVTITGNMRQAIEEVFAVRCEISPDEERP
jgi:uncharacterized membrane protein YoaK (UPF0700 family)